ncbi:MULTISPECIES: hypothetical protein [unclassified Streptomyces]|uniref:hypothetical protein n=1 Tax=unclassified Streptomyces TaxID=2593676 RepID=UPI00225176FA|nr:hypothetical protein [Streptomyces sp. NBC_00063]MCX5442872.1 hypothetical protein [Streptomyces sp. NBC_00063]
MPAIARTTDDSHRHYELLTGRCNALLSIRHYHPRDPDQHDLHPLRAASLKSVPADITPAPLSGTYGGAALTCGANWLGQTSPYTSVIGIHPGHGAARSPVTAADAAHHRRKIHLPGRKGRASIVMDHLDEAVDLPFSGSAPLPYSHFQNFQSLAKIGRQHDVCRRRFEQGAHTGSGRGQCVFPSPYSLSQYTAPKTNFDGVKHKGAYKGKLKVLMIAAAERYILLENGKMFSTGNHPVEMLLPAHHLMEAGFDIDVATVGGYPAKLELWAMPNEDEAVKATYEVLKPKLKAPKNLADVVDNDLDGDSDYLPSSSRADTVPWSVCRPVRR